MIPDAFVRVQPGTDRLEEGYYLLRLGRGWRISLPVRIWFGAPADPDDPEMVLDRSWRWQVEVAGVRLDDEPLTFSGITIADLTDVWPRCRGEPTDAADYRYRVDRQTWAAEHDPTDPFGNAGGRVDPMTARLPGM